MSISPFSSAHRFYVKSLYKRYLVNALNWTIRRDVWREQAIEIRTEFERHRNVHDPRALAQILSEMEARLAQMQHPDPYIVPSYPGGTKWERNIPPPMGEIFDHEKHNRDIQITEFVEEIESKGGCPKETLQSLRTESEEIDGYLNDYAGEIRRVHAH